MTYDSRKDTFDHINRVRVLLEEARTNLMTRSATHDQSKLGALEKAAFDIATPRLKELEYNSPEYKASLAELGVALDHHYANNSHHPEHYSDGIRGMSLLDVIEMLMDWKAASERHATGDVVKSIEQNQGRFGYSDDLKAILLNTAKEMGWID